MRRAFPARRRVHACDGMLETRRGEAQNCRASPLHVLHRAPYAGEVRRRYSAALRGCRACRVTEPREFGRGTACRAPTWRPGASCVRRGEALLRPYTSLDVGITLHSRGGGIPQRPEGPARCTGLRTSAKIGRGTACRAPTWRPGASCVRRGEALLRPYTSLGAGITLHSRGGGIPQRPRVPRLHRVTNLPEFGRGTARRAPTWRPGASCVCRGEALLRPYTSPDAGLTLHSRGGVFRSSPEGPAAQQACDTTGIGRGTACRAPASRSRADCVRRGEAQDGRASPLRRPCTAPTARGARRSAPRG